MGKISFKIHKSQTTFTYSSEWCDFEQLSCFMKDNPMDGKTPKRRDYHRVRSFSFPGSGDPGVWRVFFPGRTSVLERKKRHTPGSTQGSYITNAPIIWRTNPKKAGKLRKGVRNGTPIHFHCIFGIQDTHSKNFRINFIWTQFPFYWLNTI